MTAMTALRRLFLRLEYLGHLVDEHLARERGDTLFASDCRERANAVLLELDWSLG